MRNYLILLLIVLLAAGGFKLYRQQEEIRTLEADLRQLEADHAAQQQAAAAIIPPNPANAESRGHAIAALREQDAALAQQHEALAAHWAECEEHLHSFHPTSRKAASTH